MVLKLSFRRPKLKIFITRWRDTRRLSGRDSNPCSRSCQGTDFRTRDTKTAKPFLGGKQCDQIGQFIALWATFQSQWQQYFFPNCPHFWANFVKVSKSFIFPVKSYLGNFYRHLATFYWSLTLSIIPTAYTIHMSTMSFEPSCEPIFFSRIESTSIALRFASNKFSFSAATASSSSSSTSSFKTFISG